jgi:hypothetical protein
MRKLAIAGASVALLLATAIPAFAGRPSMQKPMGSVDVDSHAFVLNNVATVSNSGLNQIVGGDKDMGPKSRGPQQGGRDESGVEKVSIDTGDVFAGSYVGNDVNNTTVKACSKCGAAKVDVDNSAFVTNNVLTLSNSGLNQVTGGKVEKAGIDTGTAWSEGYVNNVVNTTVVK